jgi:hypothetical protein
VKPSRRVNRGANMRTATYEQKVYDQFVQHAPSRDELPDQSKLWHGCSPVAPSLRCNLARIRNCDEPLVNFCWFSLMLAINGRYMPLSKRRVRTEERKVKYRSKLMWRESDLLSVATGSMFVPDMISECVI